MTMERRVGQSVSGSGGVEEASKARAVSDLKETGLFGR